VFLRSFITADVNDTAEALTRLEKARKLAEHVISTSTSASSSSSASSSTPTYNAAQLDARVVQGDSLYMTAILQMTRDAKITGILNLRKSWKAFEATQKLLPANAATSDDPALSELVRCVEFGNGIFLWAISIIPKKFLKLVQLVGFKADRDKGLSYLKRAHDGAGVRGPYGTMLLLVNNLLLPRGLADVSQYLAEANTLIEGTSAKFPNGSLFQVMGSHCRRKMCDVDGGVEFMERAIKSCSSLKQAPLIYRYELANCYCVPEEHEILTNRGFLDLDAYEAAVAADPTLLVASYNVDAKALVFEAPNKLVQFAAATRELVELSDADEMVNVWSADSDSHGIAQCGQSNGVSMLVTKEHDVFAHVDESGTYAKHKAGDLLKSDAKYNVVRQLAVAEAGVQCEIVPDFCDELGLRTAEQRALFYEIYGFWLRDGTLRWHSRSQQFVVTFSQVNEADNAWLEASLTTLEVPYIKSDPSLVGQVTISIQSDAWNRFFAAEYKHKYNQTADEGRVFDTVSTADGSYMQPEGITSAKWFAYWVWRLGAASLRRVLAGLCRGDGDSKNRCIWTSSARFRDEIQRVCLMAGYTAHFRCAHKAAVPNWAVFFAESDGSPSGEMASKPNLSKARGEIRERKYTGRVWCFNMPSGFIWVRRVFKDEHGVVTKASRPLITGNCMKLDFKAAVPLYEELIKMPDFQVRVIAAVQLACCYATLGRSDDAIKQFKSVDKLLKKPTSLDKQMARQATRFAANGAHFAIYELLYMRRDLVKMTKYMETFLESLEAAADKTKAKEPVDVKARLAAAPSGLDKMKSGFSSLLGKKSAAAPAASTADVHHADDRASYMLVRGSMLKALGRSDDAMQCFRDIIELKPVLQEKFFVPYALYELGESLYEKGQLKEADAKMRECAKAPSGYDWEDPLKIRLRIVSDQIHAALGGAGAAGAADDDDEAMTEEEKAAAAAAEAAE
jgi:tetratricopeptide (TPR) repeat protein